MNVVGGEVEITVISCLWAPARQPLWVGRWSATPALHTTLRQYR